MAKRNNTGNDENTVETAAAEEARAEANETPTEGKPSPGEPSGDSYTGGYPKDMDSSYEGDKISVETTGNFQLYDAATRTVFPAEGSIKVPENSQFVQANLERGKLKKA